MKKKSILIFGGSGFLGYHLTKKCKKLGWNITCISRSRPSKTRKIKNIKYLKLDIASKKIKKILEKKKFDYVVNLCGAIDHKNKNNSYRSNFIAVKNLFSLFKYKKIISFVQIGSSSEYGFVNSPQNEKIICRPTSIYGKSKLAATIFLINCYKKYNFPVTVLRFYQVYGPKQNKGFIPQLINSCLKNTLLHTSYGKQKRDFLYVDDAINAIIKSLKAKNCKGKIINIGFGKSISLLKLMEYVQKQISGGKFLIGKIKLRKDEALNTYPDLTFAKKFLKWKGLIGLKRGINRTIESYSNKTI